MEPHKKSWPAVTIRVFAILNLVLGLQGFAALINSVTLRLTYNPWPQDPVYLAQAYYGRCAINFLFIVLTIIGGVYLWRVQRRGWTVCKVLFIGQIAYFFLDWFEFALLLPFGERAPLVSMALGASAGTGNIGISLQTLTGYPVIALIVLKIAYDRVPGAPPSPTAGSTPASPWCSWGVTTMESWARPVIRTFAALTLFFGLTGLLLLLASLYLRLRTNAWDQDPAYFAQAFYLGSGINLVFVLAAIWVGPQLWCLRPRAKTVCNFLFCAEIAYLCALVLATTALFNGKPSALSEFALRSAGPGNAGIGLQLLCGYPLAALVGINVAYGRLKSA
jgi:hypothetical protein